MQIRTCSLVAFLIQLLYSSRFPPLPTVPRSFPLLSRIPSYDDEIADGLHVPTSPSLKHRDWPMPVVLGRAGL
ncbi:hypothetical protein BDW66DRAFT_125021 [Aspergillus desertorum]